MIVERLSRQRHPPATLDRVEDAWLTIPQEDIQGFILSMPRRVAAVLNAHGGPTGY